MFYSLNNRRINVGVGVNVVLVSSICEEEKACDKSTCCRQSLKKIASASVTLQKVI